MLHGIHKYISWGIQVEIPVVLYTQSEIISGYITQYHEERLLDILNSMSPLHSRGCSRFLKVSDACISRPDNSKQRLAAVYIKKALTSPWTLKACSRRHSGQPGV